jgi:hypothetical protein
MRFDTYLGGCSGCLVLTGLDDECDFLAGDSRSNKRLSVSGPSVSCVPLFSIGKTREFMRSWCAL